jgi:hypothetical protein
MIATARSMRLTEILEAAPIAAAGCAIPQFVPQVVKLRVSNDAAGVAWSWATLTSVNNAAWLVYFGASRWWTAMIPAGSATLLAGTLAVMLARAGKASGRSAIAIGLWVVVLVTGFGVAGRTGLGMLLTGAFMLQVTPSLWAAYRTPRPTGISRGTWRLILGELSCWALFGLQKADPRLIALGVTGVAASLLMLARIRRVRRRERLTAASVLAPQR